MTFRTFTDDVSFDAENVSDATITVSSPIAGFSTQVGVLNAGDNAIVAGEGVTELTIEGYDEGIITAGDGVTLIVSSEGGDTWTLNVSGDVTVDATSGGEDTNVTVNGVAESTLTWDYDGAIQELTLNGAVDFIASGESFATEAEGGAVVTGDDATLTITTGSLDLIEVAVGTIQVGGEDGATVDFTNAAGQTISVVAAEAVVDIDVDAEGEGGIVSVTLEADGATLNLAAEQDADSITVNVGSAVESIIDINIGTGNIAPLTIVTADGGDASLIDALGEASYITAEDNTVTIEGAGALTFKLTGTSLDASSATGSINVTIADGAEGGDYATGAGADEITLNAESGTDVVLMAGAGNDTVAFGDADGGFAGTSVYASGEAGNDVFLLAGGLAGTVWAADAADAVILDGGAGTDVARVTFDADSEAGYDVQIDFSVMTDGLTISNIETFNIVGSVLDSEFSGLNPAEINAEIADIDIVFGASNLDGLTLSITGSVAGNQDIAIVTDGEDSTLDLSTVSIATSIEGVVFFDLAEVSVEDSLTATLTSRADTVLGVDDAEASGFDIDLGAGNDVYQIGAAGGDLALGSGSDVIVFNGDGAAIDAEDNATGVVVISDFNRSADSFDETTTANGVGADLALVDDTDVSAADAEGGTDIVAVVSDGIVTLEGTDAEAIDTVEEWIDVIEAINDTGIYAFEFDGDTYVANSAVAGAVTDVVQLVGVTGFALGTGTDDSVIVID